MLIGSCASPTPALQLSGPEFVNLAPVFLLFQFMTPLAGLCIGFAFARARLASLGYQSYVLNNLFAATLFSARIPDALHLLPLCSPPTALSHGLSLISLAAPGCFWLLLVAFCMLLVVLGLFSRFWKASWDSPWRDPKNQVSGGCLRALGKWSDLGCFRVPSGPLA